MTRLLKITARLGCAACAAGFMAVPVLNPEGWEPLLAVLPATLLAGVAVFGWED